MGHLYARADGKSEVTVVRFRQARDIGGHLSVAVYRPSRDRVPCLQTAKRFWSNAIDIVRRLAGGAALGLLISPFAATTEAAIAVLPIPLLFMILLSGGIKPLDKTPERLMSYAFPSRWAFEANIVREANARGTPTLKPQSAPFAAGVPDIADTPFPAKEGRHSYREIIAILTGMIAVLVAAVIGILRRRDIQ